MYILKLKDGQVIEFDQIKNLDDNKAEKVIEIKDLIIVNSNVLEDKKVIFMKERIL